MDELMHQYREIQEAIDSKFAQLNDLESELFELRSRRELLRDEIESIGGSW